MAARVQTILAAQDILRKHFRNVVGLRWYPRLLCWERFPFNSSIWRLLENLRLP